MDLLGQPTYLAGKPKGNSSMSEKQASAKVCSVVWPVSPVRMVKPGLVEPKFPVAKLRAHRSIPDAVTSQCVCEIVTYDNTLAQPILAERSL